MARPGQDPVAKDDVPWWLKYAGRGVGTAGSFSNNILNNLMISLGNKNC